MIVLNFTQPEMGGKSTGINSVFTSGEDGKAVSYTTKGKVQAYVQFTQPVPEGFERINQ
jgi:hypothetical protein